MKRIHAVGEGHGDVKALPNLLYRVLAHLDRDGNWLVNTPVARLPRGQLVDGSTPSPRRLPRPGGFDRAVALVLAARAER